MRRLPTPPSLVSSSTAGSARVAGVAYLLLLLGGIFWWAFIGSKLVVAGDPIATATTAVVNERLSRLSILAEVFMTLNLIALAIAHYDLLCATGKLWASLGRALVLLEAALAGVLALLGFLALQVLRAHQATAPAGLGEVGKLVGLYLDVRIGGHTISTVFLDLGMLAFYVLFFRSKIMPRALSRRLRASGLCAVPCCGAGQHRHARGTRGHDDVLRSPRNHLRRPQRHHRAGCGVLASGQGRRWRDRYVSKGIVDATRDLRAQARPW
jgi:hypothetical protein